MSEYTLLVRGQLAMNQGQPLRVSELSDAWRYAREIFHQPGYRGAQIIAVPLNPDPAPGIHLETFVLEDEFA